jgi:hypothetical protein
MSFHWKMPLAAAVVALSLGAGGALAQGPKAGPQRGAVKAAATYIGVSLQQLRTELRGGGSLASIALAHGKTVDGLEAAIVADAKTHLDKAVADGKLTAAAAALRLQKLQQRVAQLVMRTGAPNGKKHGAKKKAAIRGAVKAAATYLGLTTEQIRTQLKSGKSLAEIATAQGKSVDGLKAAIVADAKATIAKLVSSGKLSAERGQRYLAQIQKNVDRIVNAKHGTK